MPIKVYAREDPRLKKKLLARLEKLGGGPARKVVRRSLREGGKVLHRAAKAAAPRGETGKLRAGIKLRAMRRSRKKQGVRVLTPSRAFLARRGSARGEGSYSDVRTMRRPGYYPAVIEYGSDTHEEQSYLRKPAREQSPAIVRVVRRYLWHGIDSMTRTGKITKIL